MFQEASALLVFVLHKLVHNFVELLERERLDAHVVDMCVEVLRLLQKVLFISSFVWDLMFVMMNILVIKIVVFFEQCF